MKLTCSPTDEQRSQQKRNLYQSLSSRIGETTTTTEFLIFPKKLYNRSKDCMETRWLEKATIMWMLEHRTSNYMMEGPKEKPNRYVFGDEYFQWFEKQWID